MNSLAWLLAWENVAIGLVWSIKNWGQIARASGGRT